MKKSRQLGAVGTAIYIFSKAAVAASFTPLGELAGGGFSSGALGLSDDGSVVVGWSESASGTEAFRWTSDGGMVALGDLPGGDFFSHAHGVSADGSVVAGEGVSASGEEAFRWTSAGGMVGLGNLTGGGFSSRASGVSADGSVVVGYSSSATGDEAFRWTSGGGMVGLHDLTGGYFFSRAYGVSADGSVVVGEGSSALGEEAFRWTSSGGMMGLGSFAGGEFFSRANGVSADGSVVVGHSSSASGNEAFRWTSDSGMVGLGDLAGGDFFSRANAVSADGSVVVGFSISASGNEAFRWTSVGGMQSVASILTTAGVDLTGWTLLDATGVSADGYRVTGDGINPDGSPEAWMAMLNTFLDVLPGHWAISHIETLAAGGITSGCGEENYCPDDSVTRAQMAVFLERSLRGGDFQPDPGAGNIFLDVPAGYWSGGWIELLSSDGITTGCGLGIYCPEDAVTREQVAVFLLRAKHGPDYVPPTPTGVFNDVALDHWSAGWIEQLAAEGITAGCGPNIYCPKDAVTRDQMAVFLVRTFGF